MATPKQQSLSYEQITKMAPEEMERLAEADLIDDGTRDRCAHLGRFFERVSQMAPADMIVGDVLSEEDLQAVWRETAGDLTPDAIGTCPLLH